MDCFGSILLFSEENDYCQRCPLKEACAVEVETNRVHVNAAMERPIFDEEGKFWKKAQRVTRQKAAMALELSTPKPAVKPKPATPKAPPKATATPSPAVGGVARCKPFEAAQVEGLPVKVRQELEKWAARGIDPTVMLKLENPFSTASGFKFQEALSAVVATHGFNLEKGELGQAVTELMIHREGKSWSPASVQSNVNITTGAYLACGIRIFKEKT